jgi:hypothetical protein
VARSRPTPLSPEEQALAQRIGFDPAVLQLVRAQGAPELKQLTVQRVNEQTHRLVDVPAEGFTFDAGRHRAELLLRDLRPKLKRTGHLIFLVDIGGPASAARVAVARGTDHYDILRLMGTEDVNGDQTTDDVIAHLKEWEKRYSFFILGANTDWVEGRFTKLPADMAAFTREVIAFAPDSYGQGDWGSEEDFAQAMRRARGFHLWWD